MGGGVCPVSGEPLSGDQIISRTAVARVGAAVSDLPELLDDLDYVAGGLSQGYTTKCVALRLVFRCCGAGRSGFKLMCLLGRYESSCLPCVRPVNESQWKNVCWTSQVEVDRVL